MSNLDQLIDNFTAGSAPFFVIMDGRNICQGKNATLEDVQEAADRLRNFLRTLPEDSKAIYKIYCFEKVPHGKFQGEVKKVIANGDHDLLLTYCAWMPKEISPETVEARAVARYQAQQEREQMRAEIAEIKQLLMKKAIEENEEDDEEIEAQAQPNNILGALINNPQMQSVLSASLAAMVSKFFNPSGQPTAVAGVPGEDQESERIAQAIDRLRVYDSELAAHLEKLATMAETNTTQFKTLLNFL